MAVGRVTINIEEQPLSGQTYGFTINDGTTDILDVAKTYHTSTPYPSSRICKFDDAMGVVAMSGLSSGHTATLTKISMVIDDQGTGLWVSGVEGLYNGFPTNTSLIRINPHGTATNIVATDFNVIDHAVNHATKTITVLDDTPKGIRRYSQAGVFDTSFDSGVGSTGFNNGFGNNRPTKIKMLSSQKMMVSGGFHEYAGQARRGLIRLNSNGTYDSTFNSGGSGFPYNNNGYVEDMIIQSSGRIILRNRPEVTTWNGSTIPNNNLWGMSADGAIDATFNNNVNGALPAGFRVTAFAVRPDDKIIVALYSTVAESRLIRLNSNGTIDNTFNTLTNLRRPLYDEYAAIQWLYVDTGNDIYAGGEFNWINNINYNGVVKLSNNGTILSPVNSGVVGYMRSAAELPSGDVIMVGNFPTQLNYNNTPNEGQSDIRVIPFNVPLTNAHPAIVTARNTYNNMVTYDTAAGITYSNDGYTIGNEEFNIFLDYDYGDAFGAIENVYDSPEYVNVNFSNFSNAVTYLDVILTESPAWLTYNNANPANFDYVTLELWIYRGLANDYPVDPTFSFTKYKVTTGDTTVAFNVSDFVGGLINPKLSNNWIFDEGTTNHDFGETVWVRYRLQAWSGDSDSPIDSEEGTKLATKGWGLFEQGPNPQLSSNTVADPTENYLTLGHKAWEATLNLPAISGVTSNYNIVTRIDKAEEMDAVCEPKYPTYQVVYLNKNGFFEGFSFPKASREKVTIDKKDYFKLSRNPYNYSPLNHYKNVVEKNTTKEITLNTDMGLSDYDVTKLGYMVESRLHYLVDIDNNRILPVVLKTTDFEVKNRLNQKAQVQYEFTFEFANQVKNNIR